MRPDPASDVIVPGFLRWSVIGLVGSGLAIVLGEFVHANVTGTTPVEIVVRLVGAGLGASAIGGAILFLITLTSSLLYLVLRRFSRGSAPPN